MELLREHILITSRGIIEELGRKHETNAIGLTRRYTYTASNPLLFAIALPNTMRLTCVLRAGGHFVAHWIEEKDAKHFESQQHKEPTIDVLEAETIDSYRLEACDTYIECEVVDTLPCGDHTLFVGNVRKRVL